MGKKWVAVTPPVEADPPPRVLVIEKKRDAKFIEQLRLLEEHGKVSIVSVMPSDIAPNPDHHYENMIEDADVVIIGNCNDASQAEGLKDPVEVANAFRIARARLDVDPKLGAQGILILTTDDISTHSLLPTALRGDATMTREAAGNPTHDPGEPTRLEMGIQRALSAVRSVGAASGVSL